VALAAGASREGCLTNCTTVSQIGNVSSQSVQRNDVQIDPRGVMLAFAATFGLRRRERKRWAFRRPDHLQLLLTEIFMKITASILLAAALALSSAPANAVVFDLSTMTCKQFIESGDDTIKLVLTWMDGWYKGDSDEAIIDTDVFVENAKKFGTYCGKNPSISIVNAAEAVLGK
jgi:acid stress chaperone HdeB